MNPFTRLTFRSFWSAALVLCLGGMALGACKVNSEVVQQWQRTEKGPARLQIVVGSNHYSDELRIEAAEALARVDRSNAQGLSLLQASFEKLKNEHPDQAQRIAEGLVARLSKRFEAPADPMKVDIADQVHAKDTAFVAIPYLGAQALSQISEVLVKWYVDDFAARSAMGDYSVEQVFAALGPSVSVRLVDAMNARIPQASLVKIAEIVARSGNRDAQASAAKELLDIEREITSSDQFADWLKRAIVRRSEMSGAKLDAEHLALAVAMNREVFLTEGVFPAMKFLAFESNVAARLLQVAETRAGPQASKEERERITNRRVVALQVLENRTTSSDLQRLLAIALAPGEPAEVRDLAFDRIGDTGSRDAIPSLWPLVQNASAAPLERRLRWRAGELVLALGGHSVLDEFFKRLPAAESEPEELEGYAARMSQMTPPPSDDLRQRLKSPAWNARVIALRYFERRGQPKDRSEIEKLINDKTNLSGEGWKTLDPSLATVGDLAKEVSATLNNSGKQNS